MASARCFLLQVPSTVLAACCSLITAQQDKPWGLAMYAAAVTAASLPTMAAEDLRSASASSSKSNKLAVMFKAQVQQSGFLQLMPGLLSSFTEAVRTYHPTGSASTDELIAVQAGTLIQLFMRLSGMLGGPSFLTTHAAGPALVEPALRFHHASVQYVSRALQQTGQQD